MYILYTSTVVCLSPKRLHLNEILIYYWIAGRYSDVLVYLNVEDVNDNSPVFSNSSITVEIPENVNVGHTVTTVHAQDADLGKLFTFG